VWKGVDLSLVRPSQSLLCPPSRCLSVPASLTVLAVSEGGHRDKGRRREPNRQEERGEARRGEARRRERERELDRDRKDGERWRETESESVPPKESGERVERRRETSVSRRRRQTIPRKQSGTPLSIRCVRERAREKEREFSVHTICSLCLAPPHTPLLCPLPASAPSPPLSRSHQRL
jgi:hypothetical protein